MHVRNTDNRQKFKWKNLSIHTNNQLQEKIHTEHSAVFVTHNSLLIPEFLENSGSCKSMMLVCMPALLSIWVYYLCCVCKWLSHHSESFLWSNYSWGRIISNWYQKLLSHGLFISSRDMENYNTSTAIFTDFFGLFKRSVTFYFAYPHYVLESSVR